MLNAADASVVGGKARKRRAHASDELKQLRDAFRLVDKMIECKARLPGAADDVKPPAELETSIAECLRKIRGYLEASEQSEWADRLAFETDTINRGLQHDLVLFGKVTSNSTLTFTWHRESRIVGPLFDERELAIDWMRDWLAQEAER